MSATNITVSWRVSFQSRTMTEILKIIKTLEASLVDQQLIQSEMERLAKAIPEKPIRKSQLEPTVIPTTVVNSSESESSIPVNIIENTKLEVVQP